MIERMLLVGILVTAFSGLPGLFSGEHQMSVSG